MKRLLYLLLLPPLLQGGICKKGCDDYTPAHVRGPIQEYFGAYRPGNWWVYQNTARTKTDSIYVTDYVDETQRNITSCLEIQERRFTIKNSQLAGGSNLYATNGGYRTGVSMSFSFVHNQTQTGGFPQFIHDERINQLSSFPSEDNPGNNQLDSITLNNTTYRSILQGKYGSSTYYFAKGVGLVGWTAGGETFQLIRFKVQ